MLLIFLLLGVAVTAVGQQLHRAEPLLREGLLALDRNDLETARLRLEKASSLVPQEPRVWLGLAQTYLKSGRREHAENAVQKAIRWGSDDPAIQHGLALYFGSSGEWEKAAEFEAKFAETAGGPEAAARAAALYLQAQKPEQAIAVARQALERENRPELRNVLGRAYEAAGQSDKAVIELQEAIRLNPYEEAYYFDLAQMLMAHHSFDVAIEVLESSKRIIAKSPQLELALGVAYYGQRRFSDAVESFLRTIDLAPDIEQPYLFLARILDDARGRIDEVLRRFEAYRQAHPDSALGPFLVAKALMVQLPPSGYPGEAQRAEDLLRLSLGRNAESWETHYLLGSLLERKGEVAEAEAVLKRAIELSPANPAPHLPLAKVYLRMGRKQDAARERDLFKELTQKEEFAVQERAANLRRLKLRVE